MEISVPTSEVDEMGLARPTQALGDGGMENQDKAKARKEKQLKEVFGSWRVRLNPGGSPRTFGLWDGRSCSRVRCWDEILVIFLPFPWTPQEQIPAGQGHAALPMDPTGTDPS